jgi:hypothetical protein
MGKSEGLMIGGVVVGGLFVLFLGLFLGGTYFVYNDMIYAVDMLYRNTLFEEINLHFLCREFQFDTLTPIDEQRKAELLAKCHKFILYEFEEKDDWENAYSHRQFRMGLKNYIFPRFQQSPLFKEIVQERLSVYADQLCETIILYARVLSMDRRNYSENIEIFKGEFGEAKGNTHLENQAYRSFFQRTNLLPSEENDWTDVILRKALDSADWTKAESKTEQQFDSTNPRDGLDYFYDKWLYELYEVLNDGLLECFKFLLKTKDVREAFLGGFLNIDFVREEHNMYWTITGTAKGAAPPVYKSEKRFESPQNIYPLDNQAEFKWGLTLRTDGVEDGRELLSRPKVEEAFAKEKFELKDVMQGVKSPHEIVWSNGNFDFYIRAYKEALQELAYILHVSPPKELLSENDKGLVWNGTHYNLNEKVRIEQANQLISEVIDKFVAPVMRVFVHGLNECLQKVFDEKNIQHTFKNGETTIDFVCHENVFFWAIYTHRKRIYTTQNSFTIPNEMLTYNEIKHKKTPSYSCFIWGLCSGLSAPFNDDRRHLPLARVLDEFGDGFDTRHFLRISYKYDVNDPSAEKILLGNEKFNFYSYFVNEYISDILSDFQVEREQITAFDLASYPRNWEGFVGKKEDSQSWDEYVRNTAQDGYELS